MYVVVHGVRQRLGFYGSVRLANEYGYGFLPITSVFLGLCAVAHFAAPHFAHYAHLPAQLLGGFAGLSLPPAAWLGFWSRPLP